jgi:hypothetical protein
MTRFRIGCSRPPLAPAQTLKQLQNKMDAMRADLKIEYDRHGKLAEGKVRAQHDPTPNA